MKVNNHLKIIALYALLIFGILAMIILCAGLTRTFFYEDSTIIAGVIAFIGAVIGGALTLVGVYLTIEHNEKAKTLELLPQRLKSIKDIFIPIDSLIKDIKKREGKKFSSNNIVYSGLFYYFMSDGELISSIAPK
ncbi:hypothetical protein [Pseudobacillus badius]|uniref:hypothetical protein n=1 Tax=Bacillus badius TaxID=1455 RepID=UPI0007B3BCDE|nr:hypothetical protein [Bacillus badius]KZR57166.1 hypothetical protein A3781_20225 [Bacillus badius]